MVVSKYFCGHRRKDLCLIHRIALDIPEKNLVIYPPGEYSKVIETWIVEVSHCGNPSFWIATIKSTATPQEMSAEIKDQLTFVCQPSWMAQKWDEQILPKLTQIMEPIGVS